MKTRDIVDVVSSFSNDQINIIREAISHEEISEKEFNLLSDPEYTKEQMQALFDLLLVNSSDGLSKYNRLKFKHLESLMDNNMDEFQLQAIAKYITNRHFDKKEFAIINKTEITGPQIIFMYSLFNLIDQNVINKKQKGIDPEYDMFSRLHKKNINHLIDDITTYPEIYDFLRLNTTIQMLSDKEFKNSYVDKFVYDTECDAQSYHINLMYKYYHAINLNKPSYDALFLTTNNYLNYDEHQLTTILTAYSKNNIDAKKFDHVIIPSNSAEVMSEKIREILQNHLLDDEGLRLKAREKKEARIREIEAEKERLKAEVMAENRAMLARHNQKAIKEIDEHAAKMKAEDIKHVVSTDEKPVTQPQVVKQEQNTAPKPQVKPEITITKAPLVEQVTEIKIVDEVDEFVDDVFKLMEKEKRKAAREATEKANLTNPVNDAPKQNNNHQPQAKPIANPAPQAPKAQPQAKVEQPQAKQVQNNTSQGQQPVAKQPVAPVKPIKPSIIMQPNTVKEPQAPRKVEAKDPSDLDHLDQ